MFRLDLEPLSPKLLKNKEAHIDYIKHTQEHADTLQEIVEHARAPKPLDSDLDSTCKYATRIQEVLVYVSATCPSLTNLSEKLVVVTPLNKNKKVSEDLGKLKPKADIGIFVGYAPAKKDYRIYNKRTRLIIETIHVDFDEIKSMAFEQLEEQLHVNEPALSDNDPFLGVLNPEPSSEESSSRDVIPTTVQLKNPPYEHIGK
ncbi:hypothetical protein Tco_0420427 [Tanacetum coccineum]